MKYFAGLALVLALFSLSLNGCAKKSTPSAAKDEKQSSTTAAVKKETKAPAAQTAPAPATGEVSVLEGAICRSVEDRTPIGPANEFPQDVKRLYAFTKVALPAGSETAIKHVWKFQGSELANVTLPVKGPHWRTYSSKAIAAGQNGTWQVDVVSAKGKVLKSFSFSVGAQ